MKKRVVSLALVVATVLATVSVLAVPMNASPATIVVPDDYPTIQQGINAASPGDTVYVRSGTYYEHVTIDKSLTLLGDTPYVCDGNNQDNYALMEPRCGVPADPAVRQSVAKAYYGAICEYCQITEEVWLRNPANNHYYRLTEPMPWTDAEAWAQEWGGHLVTLRSWPEELWIKDTFGRNECLRIGFSDIEEEGNWVWSSGEPVVYTNWDIGEPNNCGSCDEPGCCPEDAAVMNWAHSGFGDYWNDLDSCGSSIGVAEIVTSDGQLGLCSAYCGDASISGNAVTKGSHVLAGDSLSIGACSLLALTMPASQGARTIYIGGNSKASVADKSTPSGITMEFCYGWLRVRLRDLPEDYSFDVQTPFAVVHVGGTEFILKGDETHNKITVLEGSAEVSLPDGTQSVVVSENHEIQVTSEGLGEPYAVNPDDIDTCCAHHLSISSTARCAVSTPGEGVFTYDTGTEVSLVATPAHGYRFVSWTGTVGMIANRQHATTVITMDSNYSIRANSEAISPEFMVGFTASLVNKLAVLAPLVTLFAAIIAGVGLLVLRRRGRRPEYS